MNKFQQWVTEQGGQAAVSKMFGVSRQAVHEWIHRQVPADRIFHVARVSGLTPEEIRPDLTERG